MNFAVGNSGRFYNEKWHETRRTAREETRNSREWGNVETVRWDLDTVAFSRKENDETYKLEPRIIGEAGPRPGTDVRTLPTLD